MDSNQMELHFACMALDDALATGENQIFLLPSLLKSEAIRKHMAYLAALQGVRLAGDPLILPNGALMHFLLVSTRTIAGYCGHTYALNCFDETNFADVSDLVSSWTMLKKHRAVFYSSEPAEE